jgi:hypothetical protein
MDPEELGGRLAELESIYRSGEAKSYMEIDAILQELTSLSPLTHAELSGDQQASVAKIADLRRLYTTWYNEAVEAQRTADRDQG